MVGLGFLHNSTFDSSREMCHGLKASLSDSRCLGAAALDAKASLSDLKVPGRSCTRHLKLHHVQIHCIIVVGRC